MKVFIFLLIVSAVFGVKTHHKILSSAHQAPLGVAVFPDKRTVPLTKEVYKDVGEEAVEMAKSIKAHVWDALEETRKKLTREPDGVIIKMKEKIKAV